ncbi:dihydrofolate reductase family protein [Leucobacter sp. L43]|uniref:dihydrofolate reductase family protein n=1 Tax=Leucobacter sp. L43 TaxID=2798040 RepID=UPI001906A9BD
MKITVSLQVTLDGVAQANGGNNEVVDPGFTRGGWALPLGDAESTRSILETWRRPDAFLLGRKTFDMFSAYWGVRADDGGFGEAICSTPKYVASNTLVDPGWGHTTVISGDVVAQLREMKAQQSGELLVVGSVQLARHLLESKLVDELNLVQFPVIVGEGERLFPHDGSDFGLELLEAQVFGTGVIELTYRVLGPPEYA